MTLGLYPVNLREKSVRVITMNKYAFAKDGLLFGSFGAKSLKKSITIVILHSLMKHGKGFFIYVFIHSLYQ